MMRSIFLAAVLLASGAQAQAVTPTTRQVPLSGTIATATVGSSIYELSTVMTGPGALLGASVDANVGIGTKVIAPESSRMNLEVAGSGKVRGCTHANALYQLGAAIESACFWDDDGDGRFDRAGMAIGFMRKKLAVSVPYTRTMLEFPALGGDKQTLIFSGLDGKTLRLSYREFKDDYARPAFTQDLTFTLSGVYPEQVAFRNVKITILGIDNSGMRFRLDP